MNTKETAAMLGLELTVPQLRAAAYLERLGQRFCCEFGYDNCIEKAREHWNALRRSRYRRRTRKAGRA